MLFVACTIVSPAKVGNNPTLRNRTSPSGADGLLYVSLDAEHSIALYRIDQDRGDLRFVKKITVGGEPGSLAVDPSRSYLYAAIRSTNSISSFRINAQDGDLTLINTIHVAGNPVYVGTDKTGKFLLTAYFAESKAAIYRIGPEGAVRDSAVQVLDTEQNAHALQTDPSNRFLFIPCRTGETILQFRFNAVGGTLTPNAPDRTMTLPKTGPRHFTFHPSLNVVYFANEFGSSVTAYRLDNANGSLSELQTISTLPAESVGTNTGADIHITPDGRFLYASNRGHESIAAFSVDAATGRLTSGGFSPTEKTPRSFALDPTGRFLYACGQGSGKIAAYRINSKNGELTRFNTYDAGKNPVWILTMSASR
ncbi:MAG: lactonase family protein [Ignavibacteriales bacterium]|nr:lactonase family protein [Ignavibacteriales bacterium]